MRITKNRKIMKERVKKLFLLVGGIFVFMSAEAQYLRTSYFMEGTSSRLQLNPGLQPTRGYFNIPVLGSFNVGANSNVLGTSDIIDIVDSGTDLFSNDDLYNRLKTDNRLNINLNTDILSFGWYRGKGFWSVNVGLRADVGASIPKDMFNYLRDADQFDYSSGSLSGRITNMNFDVNAYAEVGLGYSRAINEKLTVGGRFKVLLGIASAELAVDEFAVDMNIPTNPDDPSSWTGSYGGSYSARAHVATSFKGGGLSFDENNIPDGFDFDGGFGIAGTGFGIDLGASYKLLDNVTLSAAVLDLGFIKWKSGSTTTATAEAAENIQIDASNYQEFLDGDFLSLERFNLQKNEGGETSRKKKLSSTILLAGEYTMFSNKLSLGAMYTSHFVQPKALNEVTFSATYRPKNWFNLALSYSPVQASGKSFGLGLKLGGFFLGTDYMFFGNNSKSVNGFLGLSIPIGKSKKNAYSRSSYSSNVSSTAYSGRRGCCR